VWVLESSKACCSEVVSPHVLQTCQVFSFVLFVDHHVSDWCGPNPPTDILAFSSVDPFFVVLDLVHNLYHEAVPL